MEIFIRDSRNSKSPAKGYALAVAAALVALLVRGLLTPLLGDETPYLSAWAAVVFSAWYCGIGPSVVTVLLSLVGVMYFFLPPTHTFSLMNPKNQITGMVGFLIFSAFISGKFFRKESPSALFTCGLILGRSANDSAGMH